MFRHILVPVDHHPACHGAAQHAYDLTRALGGRVTLLHVLESGASPDRVRAARHLEELAAGARRPPERVVLPVADHDVQGAVVTFALRHGVDLIVLGVGREGGLIDEALGRLAVTLARRSALPVHLAGGRERLSAMVPPRWQRVTNEARRGAPPAAQGNES